MKIKTIALTLITCSSVISCESNPPKRLTPVPIASHIEQHVAISDGIDVKTGKAVVLNPLTGKEIMPCGGINIEPSIEGYDIKKKANEFVRQEKQGCLTKIIGLTPEQREFINSTRSSTNIIIEKNGKKIPAVLNYKAVISYKGSHCQTEYTAGNQYENCITKEQTCLKLNNFPSSIKSRFNGFCGEFPFWN